MNRKRRSDGAGFIWKVFEFESVSDVETVMVRRKGTTNMSFDGVSYHPNPQLYEVKAGQMVKLSSSFRPRVSSFLGT
jgi:hypothetical protein